MAGPCCPACDGTGELLGRGCPLCGDEAAEPAERAAEGGAAAEAAVASAASAAPAAPAAGAAAAADAAEGAAAGGPAPALVGRPAAEAMTVESFFGELAGGRFQSIVVLTGAGVSTAAGIPDFRSPGGLFEEIRSAWGARFPEVLSQPENLLSRSFQSRHSEAWRDEVAPWLRQTRWREARPTATHHFCAWLRRQGWLRRVYTQNVDGLHSRPEVGLPSEYVVECHGALRDASVVLYGDPLPQRFDACCRQDFPRGAGEGHADVDLVLVLGTSLQVAPFCGVPNMAPSGCSRVLVNRCLADCMTNGFARQRSFGYDTLDSFGFASHNVSTRIGSRKKVALRPLWQERRACKRWRQLLVESDCDDFVGRFFEAPGVQQRLGRDLVDFGPA